MKFRERHYQKSHALSMFLRGIIDPDYSTFVHIQRNRNESLMQAIIVLRKEERELIKKRSEKKRLKGYIRRLREEMGEDEDEVFRPLKIVKRIQEEIGISVMSNLLHSLIMGIFRFQITSGQKIYLRKKRNLLYRTTQKLDVMRM